MNEVEDVFHAPNSSRVKQDSINTLWLCTGVLYLNDCFNMTVMSAVYVFLQQSSCKILNHLIIKLISAPEKQEDRRRQQHGLRLYIGQK